MTFHLESLLNDAGIYDVATLRMLGAKMCWLRLRQMNKSITDKVLLILKGPFMAFMKRRSRRYVAVSLLCGLSRFRRRWCLWRRLSDLPL